MNTKHYNYQDGERVYYDLGDNVHSGIATVVGCATTGVVILGKQYIIRPDISIKSEQYPFDYCVCFEHFLKKV